MGRICPICHLPAYGEEIAANPNGRYLLVDCASHLDVLDAAGTVEPVKAYLAGLR